MEIIRPPDPLRPTKKEPEPPPPLPPPPPPDIDKIIEKYIRTTPKYTEYKPINPYAIYKLRKKRKKIQKSLPKSHYWTIKFGYYQDSKMLRIIKIESKPPGDAYRYYWDTKEMDLTGHWTYA